MALTYSNNVLVLTPGTMTFTQRAHINSIKLISGGGASSELTVTDLHSSTQLYDMTAASAGSTYDHSLGIRSTASGWSFTLTGTGATAYIYLEVE